MRLIIPGQTGTTVKRILKDTKVRQMNLRLSAREYKLAQRLAQEHGVTVSDLFRQKALYGRVQQQVIAIPIAAQIELGQINAQLSELLHRLRQGTTVNDITASQIEQFQSMVQVAQQQIIQALP